MHDVVRIKDEIGVILRRARCHQALKQVIKRIALAHVRRICPLVHDGARLARRLGRAIGAVVRQHIDIQQAGGIILRLQARDQLADDVLLVPGAHDGRKPVQRRLLAGLLLLFAHRRARQRIKRIKDLIQIYDKQHDADYIVKLLQKAHRNVLSTGPKNHLPTPAVTGMNKVHAIVPDVKSKTPNTTISRPKTTRCAPGNPFFFRHMAF